MIRNSRSVALVLATTLLSCASLFAAGVEIDPGTRGGTPYQIRNVSVASNGSGFLTTWMIETYRGGMHTWGTSANTLGRLDSPPRPLIPYGRPKALRSAKDGEHYQFDWGDDFGSYRSLLSKTGDRQTTERIAYDTPPPRPSAELIRGDSSALALRRYDQAGTLLPPGNIVLVPSGTKQEIFFSSLLTLGDRTLVLWSSGISTFASGPLPIISDRHLTSALVEADGGISHRTDLPFGGDPDLGMIKLLRSGNSIVALFTTGSFSQDRPFSANVAALRLDELGQPVAGGPEVLAKGRGLSDAVANDQVIYAVTFDFSGLFSQLWSYSVAIDASGMHAAPPEFLTPMPADQDAPSMASDGVNFLSVWSEKDGRSETIRFALTRPDRSPIASGNLMQVQGILGQHTVAFGGGHYLVIWQHFRQLYMQRVSIAGVPLDPAPVQFPEGIAGGSSLTAASDGQKFLIAWDGIRGVLVGAENSVLDLGLLSPPLSSPQAPHPAFPTLAWDGSHYVMAYNLIAQSFDNYAGPRFYDVVAVRIAPDGTRLDSNATLLFPVGVYPRIASNGHGLLVAAAGPNGVRGTIVTSDGASLRPGPSMTLSPLQVANVSVAATIGGYLVAWRNQGFSNWSLGPIPWFIGARSVNRDGALGPLLSIQTGPPDLETPAVVACNALGDQLIEVSEIRTPAMSPRVTAYTPDEMPVVIVPSPPVGVTMKNGPGGVIVQWSTSPDDSSRGFIVTAEARDRPGAEGSVYVGPGAHSAVLPLYLGPAERLSVRVSSWNGAGVSAQSAEAIALVPRRRTVR